MSQLTLGGIYTFFLFTYRAMSKRYMPFLTLPSLIIFAEQVRLRHPVKEKQVWNCADIYLFG